MASRHETRKKTWVFYETTERKGSAFRTNYFIFIVQYEKVYNLQKRKWHDNHLPIKGK